MKSQSLKSQILEKLNKILKNTGISFQTDDHKHVFMNWLDETYSWWTDMQHMLFTQPDEMSFSLFEDIHDLHSEVYQPFIDLNLTRLENCTSLKEVLLRLEILYPDAQYLASRCANDRK